MNAALQELSRIALIYRKLGKFSLANNVYQNIIGRLEKQGGHTLELALAHFDLAECYADQGRHERAHSEYREAAHVYSLVHPDESHGFFWYSDIMRKLGDHAKRYHRTQEQSEEVA
jgi:tetratricopeptide (TPR) repeat protein